MISLEVPKYLQICLISSSLDFFCWPRVWLFPGPFISIPIFQRLRLSQLKERPLLLGEWTKKTETSDFVAYKEFQPCDGKSVDELFQIRKLAQWADNHLFDQRAAAAWNTKQWCDLRWNVSIIYIFLSVTFFLFILMRCCCCRLYMI